VTRPRNDRGVGTVQVELTSWPRRRALRSPELPSYGKRFVSGSTEFSIGGNLGHFGPNQVTTLTV